MQWHFVKRCIWGGLLAGLFATTVVPRVHAQEQMKVGVTTENCASQTVIGTSSCHAEPVAKKPPAPKRTAPLAASAPQQASAPEKEDPVVGGVKDSEVNEFLANYGKPSREAVRALLNPSDQNIAEMLRVEQAQLGVAAYVGQRRVELTEASGASRAAQLDQSDLPSVIGMRVTVFVSPDCKGCESILPMLNQVATEFPSVDAKVGAVGLTDPKPLIARMAALGVYLPSAAVSAERVRKLGASNLPAMVIGDIRYGQEIVVTEPVASAADLVQMLVRVRKEAERVAGVTKSGTRRQN